MDQTTKLIPQEKSGQEDKLPEEESNALLDFVAIMVHDLQGPFVSMKTILKLLKNNRFDYKNKFHLELLNSSILAFNRAESIIHDLIDSAKAGNTSFNPDLEFTDIDSLINDSASMLQASAAEYGVQIMLDLKAGVKAQLDQSLFLRVMDNLLFNALKHSVKGSKITVHSDVVDEHVMIVVSDEGTGFADINTKDLFDQYKQIELRKEGKYKGVGLGLYFCRLAIEAMGGKIWAENNSQGGASFKISLIKDRRGVK